MKYDLKYGSRAKSNISRHYPMEGINATISL